MLFQVIRNVEICAPITDSLPQVLGCSHSSKIYPLIQQHHELKFLTTSIQSEVAQELGIKASKIDINSLLTS